MSNNERSDRTYWSWLESATKFDYFVTGLAFALVGYLGADLEVGVGLGLLEPIAAVLLLGSGVAGLKRIETTLQVLKFMHRRLAEEESAGALMGAGPGTLLNHSTGEVLSPEEVRQKYVMHRAGVEVIGEKLERESDRSGFWYNVRNGLLVLGLLCLIASKVLPALIL